MKFAEAVMNRVDQHVRASLEKFAGSHRDTDGTRAAVELAAVELANALVTAAKSEVAATAQSGVGVLVDGTPIPVLGPRAEVPTITPPKSKMPRIFGGKP